MSFCLSFVLCLSLFFGVYGYIEPIKIENKDGINKYWYACYISGENGDAEITEVFIRDSSSNSHWSRGTKTYYGFWAFQSYSHEGWVLPLSMRIRNSNYEEINSYTLITNLHYYSYFNFGSNFDLNSPPPPENNNIKIINKDGINEYWHAFYIRNINPYGGELTNVEIRDSRYGAYWQSGYSDPNSHLGDSDEQATFYAFQNNGGWKLPLDIRLTNCVGDKLTAYDIITNRIEFGIYDFGDNFGYATCPPPPPPSHNIQVKKFQGYNEWWVALEILGVNEGRKISKVELRNGGYGGIWNVGKYNDWGNEKPWTFDVNGQDGRPFVLPFDIRITDEYENVITADNLVTHWDDGKVYDCGTNFY